jgi:DNA-binding transcriptional LysR family regulator
VDRPLAELGLKRNAVLRGPYFLAAIFTVARSDLILTVPRRMGKIAVATAAVRVVEPPREIKDLTYFMAWHARLTTEPPHAWFRDQLRMAARRLGTK